LEIGLLGEDLDNVHDGEKPSLGLLIVEAADFAFLEDGGDDFHGWQVEKGKDRTSATSAASCKIRIDVLTAKRRA
jgi:hypothetical protein